MRPILTGKMSITSACASILSTKTNCWPICDRKGSPSILLNRATAREGDGPSIYFSDPDGNRIELKAGDRLDPGAPVDVGQPLAIHHP